MPTPLHAEIRLLRSLMPSSSGPLLRLPQGLAITAVFFLLATGVIDGMITPPPEHAAPARLSRLASAPTAGQPGPLAEGFDVRLVIARKEGIQPPASH